MEKARDLGERLDQADVVSSALTGLGNWLVDSDQDGIGLIEQGLRVALDAHLQQTAGGIYTCIQDACVNVQRLEEAQRYYTKGMAFCEQRELRYNTRCLRGGQADTLLLLGQWDEAADICEQAAGHSGRLAREPALPVANPGHHPRPPRRARCVELPDKGLALAEE